MSDSDSDGGMFGAEADDASAAGSVGAGSGGSDGGRSASAGNGAGSDAGSEAGSGAGSDGGSDAGSDAGGGGLNDESKYDNLPESDDDLPDDDMMAGGDDDDTAAMHAETPKSIKKLRACLECHLVKTYQQVRQLRGQCCMCYVPHTVSCVPSSSWTAVRTALT